MKLADFDLRKMLKFEPEQGKLLLGDDRLLIFREEAFAILRKLLYDQVGAGLAAALLAQFGYRCGKGDFETLNKAYTWDTEQDRFGAGPVMHTWEGIVHVTPVMLEFDRATKHFHMRGIWRNSYEAAIHVRQFGVTGAPVCHSLTGYASGWCSAFFGDELLAIESKCVGKGDAQCEFEIRPPAKWGDEALPWKRALSSTENSLSRELEQKLAVIDRQRAAIRELSTPVLQLWDGVLALPIIGVVDSRRSAEIMERLLTELSSQQARYVILDITGVEVVDTKTADHFVKVMKAAELLGSHCMLTGIRPAVAQTLVELGVDLSSIVTLRTLQDGLRQCIKLMEGKDTGGLRARP